MTLANTLRLIRGTPNPRGAPGAELFLFVGDATQRLDRVILDEGITLPEPRTDLREHPFHLHILHLGDLHGNLARVTAHGDVPVFSRIVSHLRESRRAVEQDPYAAAVFLSAGDDLTGSPFDELLCDPARSQRTHAAYRLYSEAGLDLAILGNHDFDFGTKLLADSLRNDSRFPVLCANLANCEWLAPVCFPAALLVIKGVRVGMVGLTTAAEVIRPDDPDLVIRHPADVARNILPAVRPWCDILILITHLGHTMTTPTAIVCDVGDVELAQGLSAGAVDLIVGAHTHLALNETGLDASNVVNQVPIFQAGADGDWLGEIELTLNPRVSVTRARLIRTASLPVDEEFDTTYVQPLAKQVSMLLAERIGSLDDLGIEANNASENTGLAESPLANFVNDAIVSRCRAGGHVLDFAMLDRSAICFELPMPGEITFEDWFRLMPHADVVRICEMSGEQFKLLLDDNARRAVSRKSDSSFLQFSRDLRYRIELGAEGSSHAVDIRVRDVPLEALSTRTFRVACSSFSRQRDTDWRAWAATNKWHTISMSDLSCKDTPLRVRDELISYIRSCGGVTADSGARRDGRVTFPKQKS